MNNKQRDAVDAAQLLNNPIFVRTMNDIRQEIFNTIRRSDLNDIETREEAYKLMYIADKFEDVLNRYVKNGKVSAFIGQQKIVKNLNEQ